MDWKTDTHAHTDCVCILSRWFIWDLHVVNCQCAASVWSDDHYSAFTENTRPKLMLEVKKASECWFCSVTIISFFSLLLWSRNKCKESWNIKEVYNFYSRLKSSCPVNSKSGGMTCPRSLPVPLSPVPLTGHRKITHLTKGRRSELRNPI